MCRVLVLSGGTHILRCPPTLGPSLAVLGVVVQRWTQRPTDTHGSGMYGGTEH